MAASTVSSKPSGVLISRKSNTPPSEVMSPPENSAWNLRRFGAGKSKAVWVVFVTGKTLFEFNLSN
jgi:hypothetical protein